FLRHASSLWPRLDEQLAVQLGPPLRAAADEANDGLADLDAVPVALRVEDRRERLRLPRRVVRLEVQLGKLQLVPLCEELVDPLAWRMELQAVARVRGDERPPPTMLLHAQLVLLGPVDGRLELVLVEHEPEVVDPRGRPLARLDDDVHGALLELGQ